ncbi:CDP-glucose 4,6-dehydratase [Gammaproteobacteria bacterium]|nr:CDP-glucose 4,6-dehydratase [Gammaproteobacteria bacterium]
MTVNPRPEFWHGKRVLLTGHTGFKGAWLAFWLTKLGAKVIGIGLDPQMEPNLYTALGRVTEQEFFVDIRNNAATRKAIHAVNPDLVFHLAAQALVRISYTKPLETIETNVLGTANVLDALRETDKTRVVVAITTDKVYADHGYNDPYQESDSLGGFDPYSSSKAAAEMVISSYRDAYLQPNGIAVATARSGNVIGGGDWALDRLIPDALRAWSAGEILTLRNPHAVRPWQHVLEALACYLLLAEKLWFNPKLVGAYNCGPNATDTASVETVVSKAGKLFNESKYVVRSSDKNVHESDWLMLDTAKARNVLGWYSKWSLDDAIARTIFWYQKHLSGDDARALCESDIAMHEMMMSAVCDTHT